MENSSTINTSQNVTTTNVFGSAGLQLISTLKSIYANENELGKEAIRSSLLTWLNEEKTRAIFNKTMGKE